MRRSPRSPRGIAGSEGFPSRERPLAAPHRGAAAAAAGMTVAGMAAWAPKAAESTTATVAGRSSHAGSGRSRAAKSLASSSTPPTASTTASGSSHHAGRAPPKPVASAHASATNRAISSPATTAREGSELRRAPFDSAAVARAGECCEGAVSYTHLTLPTIYSV